ncbi:prolyl oligopeptidase family serine peptidase [Roseivirga sp.]|uniref:S9 family peptidase n=1 Tax=Roseivirga sp. TaxID=1964215 RepID=UPI003B8DA254
MKITINLRSAYFSLALLFLSVFAFGQSKKALNLEDYKIWNSIRNTVLSPNGEWMTYTYAPNEGDATLHIRQIDGDTIRTATNAKQVSFSEDSKWVAYMVDPAKKVADKLRAGNKPVVSNLHLVDLNTNAVQEIKNAKSYSFSKDAKLIAIHKNAADKKAEHSGSDLILRYLESGVTANIGNVSSYAFNKAGTLLAFLVDADGDGGNGIYIMDLTMNRKWPLHTSASTYAQMTWNKAGDKIAVLYGKKEDGNMQRDNALFWTTGLTPGMANAYNDLYEATASNFPKGMVISEYARLSWNESGTQIYLGIKEQQQEVKKENQLKANVDVWHWKDEQVQSTQIVRANRDRRATYAAVLNLSNANFIQLANSDMPNVNFSDMSNWAVGREDKSYRNDVNNPSGFADLYSINTKTGEKQLIKKGNYFFSGMSPNGQWAMFSTNAELMGYNFESGETVNLTKKAGVSFLNTEFDKPTEKPTYGIGGWSADGNWVLVNNKFDVWAISMNGNEAMNLTKEMGNDQSIRFRAVQLDPEAKGFDMSKPILLSAYGEWTKKSGYYEVKLGKKPKALRFEDKMIGRLIKAKNADRIVYTEQTFVDFPDYWMSDLSFKKPQQITDANPQQSDYKWGKRILVDYTDKRGHKLQGTLALPADYEEGKKYPMVIYFYERMSQRHHQYSMPTYDDRPHMSTYASNGYLVLMPDIVFDVGLPGSSALDDVTSAAQAVIDLGYADPERIGLQGHSWGGYESSFIVTQTDMFACVITGAPLTNLISMYNVAYKRTGNLNGPILEWSQGRMGVSPWDNMELYRSQSPIHHAKHINTPFMILHGTADGAVDWVQGLEYYSTARRLGKEVILLSYPDEPHHLGKEANQKDFQIRMKQYFDHYLKGTQAPLWMREGVKHLDKKKIGPEVMEKGN